MIPFSFWHSILVLVSTGWQKWQQWRLLVWFMVAILVLIFLNNYCWELTGIIFNWLLSSLFGFISLLQLLFRYCSVPCFLFSFLPMFCHSPHYCSFILFSIILLFFNPVTLKSYKHLHVISPYKITPKSKNLKKWSATRCEGALAG